MTKNLQDAFNKALLDTVRNNKDRKIIFNKNTKSFDVVIPVSSVIKNFKKFIKLANKQILAKPTTKKLVSKNKKIKKVP